MNEPMNENNQIKQSIGNANNQQGKHVLDGEREKILLKRNLIEYIFQLEKSLAPFIRILSEKMKSIPVYWKRAFMVISLAFLFSPRLFSYSIVFFIAFIMGMIYRYYTFGDQPILQMISRERLRTLTFIDNLGMLNTYSRASSMTSIQKIDASSKETMMETIAIVNEDAIPEPLNSRIKRIIDLILRDFVYQWYKPLCFSKIDDFPQAIRKSLYHSIFTVGNLMNEAEVPNALVGVLHRILFYMTEYRNFESTKIAFEEYIVNHSESSFARLATENDVHGFLRNLTKILIDKGMPSMEKSSSVVLSFVEEILTTSVLNSVVTILSDPDWINQQIIALARESETFHSVNQQEKISPRMSPSNNLFSVIDKSLKSLISSNGSSETVSSDQIHIKVVEARNVPKSNRNGLYCVILCGKQSRKTKKTISDSNPIWLENFTMTLDTKKSKMSVNGIVIDLYSSNLIQDELVGSIYIHINDLAPNQFIKNWYPLETSKDSARSVELNLELTYIALDLDTDQPTDLPEDHVDLSTDTEEIVTHIEEIEELPAVDVSSLLSNGESLMEFMQFMEEAGGSSFIQLYIMIDSFIRFTQITGDSNNLENLTADAQSIYDSFFLENSRYHIDPLIFGEDILHDLYQSIKTDPRPGLFDILMNKLISHINKHYLPNFIKSDRYKQLLKEGFKPIRPRTSSKRSMDQPRKSGEIFAENNGVKNKEESLAKSRSSVSSNSNKTYLDPNEPGRYKRLSNIRSGESMGEQQEFEKAEELGGTHLIITALTSIREQIMILESKIQNPDEPKIAEMIVEKIRLQSQAEELLEMVEQFEKEKAWIPPNVYGLNARIFDASSDPSNHRRSMSEGAKEISPKRKLRTPSSNTWDLIFAIHLSKDKDDSFKGWMLTRSYDEFLKLRDRIVMVFPKIDQVMFPPKPKSNYSGWGEAQRFIRSELAQGLNNWLNLIFSDSVISESLILRHFLKANEQVQLNEERTRAATDTPIKDIIKTTGNSIRKTAEQAGKLALSGPRYVANMIQDTAVVSADVLLNMKKTTDPNFERTISQMPAALQETSPSKIFSPSAEIDTDMLLECVFAVIDEAFSLSDPSQWLRQKGLYFAKSFMKKSYGDTIANILHSLLDDLKSPESISQHLDKIIDAIWPNGVFIKSPDVVPVVRSEEEKLETKLRAKKIFLQEGLQIAEGLSKILGKYNTIMGLSRLFMMLQDSQKNRVLICLLLDTIVKSTLTDD